MTESAHSICSDDTDFLVAQANNFKVKPSFDDCSNATTDLLYQRSIDYEIDLLTTNSISSGFVQQSIVYQNAYEQIDNKQSTSYEKRESANPNWISNNESIENSCLNLDDSDQKNRGSNRVTFIDNKQDVMYHNKSYQYLSGSNMDLEKSTSHDVPSIEEIDEKVKEGHDLLLRFLGDTKWQMDSLENVRSKSSSDNQFEYKSPMAYGTIEKSRSSSSSNQKLYLSHSSKSSSNPDKPPPIAIHLTTDMDNVINDTSLSTESKSILHNTFPKFYTGLHDASSLQHIGSSTPNLNLLKYTPPKEKSLSELNREATKSELEISIEELKSIHQVKQDELFAIKQQLFKSQQDVESCKQLVNHYEQKAFSVRKDLMSIEEEKLKTQTDLSNLRVQVNNEKANAEYLKNLQAIDTDSHHETELALVKQERDNYKFRLDKMNDTSIENDILSDKVKDLQTVIDSMLKDFKFKELEHKNEILTLKKSLFDKDTNTKVSDVNQLEMVSQLKNELKSWQLKKDEELDEARKIFENEKMSLLESLKTSHSNELRILQEKLEHKERILKEQHGGFASAQNELRDVQQKFERMRVSNDEKDKVIILLQNQEVSLKNQSDSKVSALEERNISLEKELDSIVKEKNAEINVLHDRLKAQENATRSLGDEMREQAKEQVNNAVMETKKSAENDTKYLEDRINDLEGQRKDLLADQTTQMEKKNNIISMLQESNTKLKKEVDALKKQLYASQRETMNIATKCRSEARNDAEKMRLKVKELSQVDKKVAFGIIEECAKLNTFIRELPWSSSYARSDLPSTTFGKATIQSSLDALISLRNLHESVKQCLLACKSKKPTTNSETNPSLITNDINNSTLELSTTNLSFTNSTSSNREGSTTKLLQHLQTRVKQLRTENQSLKSSGDVDYPKHESDSHEDYVPEAVSQNPSVSNDHIVSLEESLQKAENESARNLALLGQKMTEMTKLQTMLTQATKENMKLERAYANLQQSSFGDPKSISN